MKRSFIATLFATCSSVIILPVQAIQPHQAYLDLFYAEQKDADSTGEYFQLHVPIKQGLYFSMSDLSFDGENPFKAKELGGGIYWVTSDNASMYIGYGKIDYETPLFKDSFNKYSIGWRSRLTNNFELHLEFNQSDFTDETAEKDGYIVGAFYHFSETFALTYQKNEWNNLSMDYFGVRFTSGY